MNTTLKNMFVGIFVLSALTVLIMTILFLKPTIGDAKYTMYVRFSDIGSLHEGTRVLFAGKPVGEVVHLEEIEEARNQPTDQLGRVYFYQLTLHLDSSVKVYNTDEISIQTSGLLGEKSIAITPKAPPQGVTPLQITDQPVYADSVDSFQNALLDFSELAASMEDTFKQAGNWMKDNGKVVAMTVQAAGAAMEELEQMIHTVNEVELVQDVQSGIQKVNTALDELESNNTFTNFAAIMETLKSTTKSIDFVANEAAQGKGTLGKLLVDEDLYLQMNAILTKGNNLMNDVNQYGVLFHLNKQWQRTHVKRMSQLNSLNNPEAFKTYFSQEVDEINSSMTRLSIVIDRAKASPSSEEILHSKPFQKDFADLLRRVDELSNNLRLYNQQLQDALGN